MWGEFITMNKSQIITAIIKRHGAAFIGLTSEQRDALHNAMCAAYTAGNQARPDYNLDALLDGDTSERLTPQAETMARIYVETLPLPNDIDAMRIRLDEIEKAKREFASMTPDKVGDWLFGPTQPDRADELKREIEAMKREIEAMKREGEKVVA